MRLRGLQFFMSMIVSFTLLTMALLSCNAKKNNSDILTPEQMVVRLADVYILEQKVVRLTLSSDSAQGAFNRMKNQVFQKSGLTDSVFKKSFYYYVDRPAELEKIYTALIDTLSLREQRMEITSYPKK